MTTLERLRGGLIVSVQAEAGSPLQRADVIALLARVAERNGAAGVRAEGAQTLRAVRAAVGLPVIGIVKRPHPGFAPYITSTVEEVAEVAATGVALVAFDATARPRADGSSVEDLADAAHAAGLIAVADCSTVTDARDALRAGCDVVATTLAGYTEETRGRPLPALDLVAQLRKEHPFVVCEGGITTPKSATAAFAAGAAAVVVGTAITNVDALVRRFVAAVR